jgi:hypothetical protein
MIKTNNLSSNPERQAPHPSLPDGGGPDIIGYGEKKFV